MLIGLAWRNIWRNRKRSFVILTAIALGLCGGLFALGIMVGSAESMVNSAIDRNLAHVQLHSAAYKDNPVLNNSIPSAMSVADSLRRVSSVVAVSARSVLEGMASSATTNTGVQIVAVDPDEEASVSSIKRSIKEGTYFDSDMQNSILVGNKLVEKLDLRLRSKLVLSFSGNDGSITYVAYRIVGIYETESSIFDLSTVFILRSELSKLIEGPDIIHEIALRLKSADDVPATLVSIKTMFPQLIVESWKDLAPELKITAELTGVSMMFFLGIILFALLFGITNTMLMSVMDRVREFGVLMAIGMKRFRIFSLILMETAVLSLLGGIIGVLAGAGFVWVFASVGIDLSAFADGLSAYGIATILYPIVPNEVYLQLSVLVVLTAIVAAIYPGYKATRMKPAQAIRVYV